MTPGLSCEILDLRHFPSAALRPLLEAEVVAWRDRLHWDYQPSSRMLLQYLDAHLLPGYVATDGASSGRVLGYVFFVYEDTKAVIGDLFVMPDVDAPRELEMRLLRHAVETLVSSPQIERIESQLLIYPEGEHAEVFQAAGFRLKRRLFLARPLTGMTPEYEAFPSGLELRGWRDEDLHPASRLIADAYHDHPDSRINDQYRSVAGSLRFLHNIVRFPGCGVFSGAASFVVVDRLTREMVAVALGSRISPTSGHITQICVHPAYRRHGLGKRLLAAVAAQFQRMGLSELSLTVTEENEQAVRLYLAEGYRPMHSFDAAVYTK